MRQFRRMVNRARPMTADLVLKERAAPHTVAGVALRDAARASDLTFVSIHTPHALRLGRLCI